MFQGAWAGWPCPAGAAALAGAEQGLGLRLPMAAAHLLSEGQGSAPPGWGSSGPWGLRDKGVPTLPISMAENSRASASLRNKGQMNTCMKFWLLFTSRIHWIPLLPQQNRYNTPKIILVKSLLEGIIQKDLQIKGKTLIYCDFICCLLLLVVHLTCKKDRAAICGEREMDWFCTKIFPYLSVAVLESSGLLGFGSLRN